MKKTYLFKFIFSILLFFSTYTIFATTEAFFAPDDHPKRKLIELISNTQNRIHAAVYMFTDKDIAQALIQAKQRGVDVKIILDPITIESTWGQAKNLSSNQIEVFIFDTKQHHSTNYQAKMFIPIMHNKFAILDNQVWTGSFNWTQNANQKNHENVIITDDETIIKKYEERFMVLQHFCFSLAKKQITSDNTKRLQRTKKSLLRLLKEIIAL